MKKVVNGTELKEKMVKAINLLCNTVKTTLGPKGNNVIIDHSAFSPFITNDGVTIAENIESEDEVINTILELAKESSIKTNLTVGDGTTTTLVLLQSIFNEGIEEIEKGKSPILLKKELSRTLKDILSAVEKESLTPTDVDLTNIALTSAGSEEIGSIISEAYKKVSSKEAINIKESDREDTEVIYKKGYSFETILTTSYFLEEKDYLESEDAYLLIVNNYLTDLEEIAIFVNEALAQNKPLIILADDYSEELVNDLLSLHLESGTFILPLKIPEYGRNKQALLKDLALISTAQIILDNNPKYFTLSNLGLLESVKVTKEQTTIYFEQTEEVITWVEKLKELLKSFTGDKEFLVKRISMFETGLIDIFVGAPTATERREKKMRYDDALCALSSTDKGILLGGGVALYKISESIEEESSSAYILKNALQEPFKQVMTNAGLNSGEVISKIKDSNWQEVYNIVNARYESKVTTTVIDPTAVVLNALVNATSIASMLLTTTSLIINEYKNNVHKVNDFNDL